MLILIVHLDKCKLIQLKLVKYNKHLCKYKDKL